MSHRLPYHAARPVAFLHVPKSAGSSLTSALAAALRPAATVNVIDRCMFGAFAAFDRLDEAARRTIVFDAGQIPATEFLAGHLSLSVLSHASPHAQFITVLREPTSRLISLWVFWRSLPRAFYEAWRPWSDVVRTCHLPLRGFLQSRQVACQTDDQALRLLLWPHPLIPDGDFIDERHDATLLDEARARLEQFSVVDVVENPALMENLEAWLQRPIALHRVNETEGIPDSLKSPMADELDAPTSQRIASLSRLDEVLWADIVTQQMRGLDWQTVRDRTVARNLANYSRLMAPSA